MSDQETFELASEIAEVAGTGIAAVAGIADAPIALAAGAGAAIGMGIEYATDGAVSGAIADGLLWAVGDEESLAAANAFDDGDAPYHLRVTATEVFPTGVIRVIYVPTAAPPTAGDEAGAEDQAPTNP